MAEPDVHERVTGSRERDRVAELDRAGRTCCDSLLCGRIPPDLHASRDREAGRLGDFVHTRQSECSEFARLDVELRDAHDLVGENDDVARRDVRHRRMVDGVAPLNISCIHFVQSFLV